MAVWRCQGSRNCLGFIVGTGLGGSAIVDGVPMRGSDGVAGEFGHLIFEPGGRACDCGGAGCLEQYVSGTALRRDYVSRVTRADVAIVQGIAARARSGDIAAADAFAVLGHRLGVAVASLTNVFNPDTVILGGGLIEVSDLFLPAVRSAVLAHTMPMTRTAMTIKTGVSRACRRRRRCRRHGWCQAMNLVPAGILETAMRAADAASAVSLPMFRRSPRRWHKADGSLTAQRISPAAYPSGDR